MNPYIPTPKKVIYYYRESHDSFTIRLDWKLTHGVGQFVFCSLPGIGEAPISICSHNENYVELNIREVGNVTKHLANLKEGTQLLVRGAYGTEYPMPDMKGKNLFIVGGGCGVAPLKGIIEYVEANRKDFKDVHLLFGFRNPGEILFSKHFDDWNSKFKTRLSFDELKEGESVGVSCLSGSQGFVTQLVDDNIKDNANNIAILCGPPIMIEKTIEKLKAKNFADDQIYLSAERLMYCGIGKCGRCMIHGKYTCLDGPVFRYDQLKDDNYD